MTTQATRVHVRWMIDKDLDIVTDIDAVSYRDDWTDADFRRVLRERNMVGITADIDGVPVGYMVYGLHKGYFDLVRLAVHPDYRRQGVGSVLLERLLRKADAGDRGRDGITADVSEWQTAGHLFLKAHGFIAEGVQSHSTGDVYEMAYVSPAWIESASPPA